MLIGEDYWIKKEGGEFLQEKYNEIVFNIIPSSYNLNDLLLIPFQSIYNERITRYYELSLREYVHGMYNKIIYMKTIYGVILQKLTW